MRFDSNRAWQQATAAIAANREVLFALSGVFFLIPLLALALLVPPPAVPAGLAEEAAMKLVLRYYADTAVYLVPVSLAIWAGALALLALLTARRPTVGEAIRTGLVALLPCIAARLVLGLAAGILGSVVLALAGASGSAAISAAAVAAVLVGLLYLEVRTSLTPTVIAVDGVRNPIDALSRSWRMTAGAGLRLSVFYALIAVAGMIVIQIAQILVGVALALLLPAPILKIVLAVLAATLASSLMLIFIAVLAAVHAQLGGREPAQ